MGQYEAKYTSKVRVVTNYNREVNVDGKTKYTYYKNKYIRTNIRAYKKRYKLNSDRITEPRRLRKAKLIDNDEDIEALKKKVNRRRR